MFDYDLVIIGGSIAGVCAAKRACQLKARVALVQPPSVNFLENEIGRFQQQQVPVSSELSFYDLPVGESYSPAMLAFLGIDVMIGEGQFRPKPKLFFEVNDRRLRSRAYLLAPELIPVIPDNIEGLTHEKGESLNQQVLDRCRYKSKFQTPHHLIVIGSSPQGIEIAQTYSKRGSKVTVVVRSDRIFPQEDAEAAFLLQSQLESDGIRVLTNTSVSQIKNINDKIWVQAGNEALEADRVFMAMGQQPKLQGLNLDRIQVETVQDEGGQYLKVNQKLQTTRSLVYSCGKLSQKDSLTNVTIHETNVALKNALFWPMYNIDYHKIPRAMFTDPQFARIGLTEAEATEQYGQDTLVFRQYFKNIAAAQLQGETTGFCKAIARRNGQLLGVHIVGPQASELIHSFALAMQHQLTLDAIASMPHIFPSLSEINARTAQLWQYEGRIRSWQKWLEFFFSWRRG